MMKNSNLKGLEEDLNRGIEYNKKHGGVSDALKKTMKRPEGQISHFSESIGGSDEFWEMMEYQRENKCCWMCNKVQGRIIDDKYCSQECKDTADKRNQNVSR